MKEKLSRAFQLAYFILRELQAALLATREAVSALDVTLVRQDKRVHYLPTHRTKVSLGEWQMLQRLVYFVSEPEERRQEEHGVPGEALADESPSFCFARTPRMASAKSKFAAHKPCCIPVVSSG